MNHEIKPEIFLLYISLIVTANFGFKQKLHDKYGALKEKFNKVIHGKKGSELFMDIDEFEYPGSNNTIREIYKEQWLDYYECLKERYVEAGPEKTLYPIALMTLEGTTTTLKCQICISPAEMHMMESIEWYFNSSSNASITNEYVDYSEHTLISPDDRSLIMYNIRSGQSGQYWCKMENTIAAPYYLHVDNGSEPISMVRPDTAPNALHAAAPSILPEYNLKVYSTWTDWSACSACGMVGKKLKYGYCTVSSLETSAHRYVANESAPKLDTYDNSERYRRKVEDQETQIDRNDPQLGNGEKGDVVSIVKTVLPIYRNKLPCRSKHTPKEIQNLDAVKNRKTEILVRYCKLNCSRNVVFEVRDKSGNVLESANNSAGIYSMLQGIPEAPPSVTRVTLYEKHDKRSVLRCPGNLNTDTPIVWQIGSKLLVPSVIIEQSGGRIYIDEQSRVVFKKLRFSDANLYSCWQEGKLAGTIRLEVTQEIEIKFDHHVVMIGGIAIVGTMLLVFWRAFQGRKRITKH